MESMIIVYIAVLVALLLLTTTTNSQNSVNGNASGTNNSTVVGGRGGAGNASGAGYGSFNASDTYGTDTCTASVSVAAYAVANAAATAIAASKAVAIATAAATAAASAVASANATCTATCAKPIKTTTALLPITIQSSCMRSLASNPTAANQTSYYCFGFSAYHGYNCPANYSCVYSRADANNICCQTCPTSTAANVVTRAYAILPGSTTNQISYYCVTPYVCPTDYSCQNVALAGMPGKQSICCSTATG